MRLPILFLVVVLTIAAALPASAQRIDSRMFSARLDRIERDVALIQRQLARGGVPVGNIDMADETASLQVKHAQIEEQLRAMQGSIEEAQHRDRQLSERLDKLQKDMEFRLGKLEQGSFAPGAPSSSAPTPLSVPPGEPDADEAMHPVTPPAPASPEPPHTLSAAPRGANPRDDYNAAFKLLRQAKHAEAAASFEAFLKNYPGDPLTGNAYYWLGESYYVQRDYVKAADSFRKGFEALPSGPKAADNLYKLALSLSAVKENDKACVVLNQLIKKYGATSQNLKKDAQKEIDRLNCKS